MDAEQRRLLVEIHGADRDEGGLDLAWNELDDDQRAAVEALLVAGLVEWRQPLEDADPSEAGHCLRVTGRGVAALREDTDASVG